MREDHPTTGKPSTYWIVHGTVLLRVAPEHIRPRTDDESSSTQNLEAAKQAAQRVKTRSTTQYIDIRSQRTPPEDVDSDEETMEQDSRQTGPVPMDMDSGIQTGQEQMQTTGTEQGPQEAQAGTPVRIRAEPEAEQTPAPATPRNQERTDTPDDPEQAVPYTPGSDVAMTPQRAEQVALPMTPEDSAEDLEEQEPEPRTPEREQTFQERRREFDQSETTWMSRYGPSRPERISGEGQR